MESSSYTAWYLLQANYSGRALELFIWYHFWAVSSTCRIFRTNMNIFTHWNVFPNHHTQFHLTSAFSRCPMTYSLTKAQGMSLLQTKVTAWCHLNYYCLPQNRKLILKFFEAAEHLATQNLGQQIPCTSNFWLPIRIQFLYLLLLGPGHYAEGHYFDEGTLFFTYLSLGGEALFFIKSTYQFLYKTLSLDQCP